LAHSRTDCFDKDLRITLQALGWRSGRCYLPLMDEIASVAYWYQIEPDAALFRATVQRSIGCELSIKPKYGDEL
jgi:hypothetical protein